MDFHPPEPETPMYTDDVSLVAQMLKDQWSLGPDQEPNIQFEPEAFMANSMTETGRNGLIYVYQLSRTNRVASTDYRTLERTSHISIRVSNRFRNIHYLWCDEVYRILLANRRLGNADLNGYTFLEINNDQQSNDLSGYYTTTFDIKLTCYASPIRSHGFSRPVHLCDDGQGSESPSCAPPESPESSR